VTESSLNGARLAILVHEVRSPVAALSAVEETFREASLVADMRSELVRLALAACRAIERIIVDVAVASVHLERLDAGALVRDAVAAHAMRGANVVALVDATPLDVDGDPVRLRQVVDNLVANALAYGDAGEGVRVRAGRSTDGRVEIDVSDSGPGIHADELPRIFEIGVRFSDGTSGSGLGLPLARAIVEAHGGSLKVESTAGEGSTFRAVLPARTAQPATRPSTV
jgi:two-component system sensor histidine kinase BaeS